MAPQEGTANPTAGRSGEAGKLNQIVQHYYLKAVLVVLRSRVELPLLYTRETNAKKVDRWFNIEIEDSNAIKEPLLTWRNCDVYNEATRPPPLILETYLDASDLNHHQSLVILDSQGRRWDAWEGLYSELPNLPTNDKRIVLERWRVELGNDSRGNMLGLLREKELASVLPTLYKKCVAVFRELYTYTRYLPAWNYVRNTGKARPTRRGLKVRWRVVPGSTVGESRCPNLEVPLYQTQRNRDHHYGYGQDAQGAPTVGADDEEFITSSFNFGTTDSPAGPLSISVRYRTNCDFLVDDSEALLSSKFMGADKEEDMVKQALAPEGIQLPESLPSTAGDGHASSFRASSAKSGLGGSPSSSPGPFNPARAPRPATHTRQRTSSLVSKLMEEARKPERRPSLNFPIFKTPTLSSSPKRQSHISGEGSSRPGDGANVVAAHSQPPPTTLGNYLNSPADDRPKSREVPPYTTTPSEGARAREIPRLHRGATVGNVVTRPQTATSLGSRRTVSTDIPYAAAGASSSSTSAGSSRPKYSSSFGQRRSRLSLGGNSNPSNPEDEPALSRRASLVSLQQGHVPPSSAFGGHGYSPSSQYDVPELTGFAESFGSLHADHENITDFLKMLDSNKDLMRSGYEDIGGGSSRSSHSSELGASQSRLMQPSQPSGGMTTVSALSRFYRMRESNKQLSDSMSNSFMFQQRPAVPPPRQIQAPPQQPMTAISVSPHTPAIPSRLSAASNIDYDDAFHTAVTSPTTGLSRASRNPASTTEEPSERNEEHHLTLDTDAPSETTSSATPIDIPASPRRLFLEPYRRPTSAAPQSRSKESRESDGSEDLLPFGMRTLSLGYGEASRRAPPSVDELLKGRPEAKENIPPNQENAHTLTTTAEASVTGANNITSGPYRPRFGKSFASMGEPNINASDYAPSSSREAIGDDQASDNRSGLTFPTDDTCPSFTPPQSSRPPTRNSMTPSSGGGSYSSLNPGSTARHSSALPHRPSFHRPQYLRGRYSGSIRASSHLQHGSTGSLDEDEPLLFAMSDVGTSRRSLEERERQREKGKDRAATEVAEDPELEDL